MEFIILDSALKHGVTRQSIMFCLLHFHNYIVLTEYPLKRMFAGFDHNGNALEIAVLGDDDDHLVVIHAMKLRPQYYYLLEETSYEL